MCLQNPAAFFTGIEVAYITYIAQLTLSLYHLYHLDLTSNGVEVDYIP